ncbi:MAG: 4Fe-4S binding protein, partial [Planctomycetota bacterium]
MAQSGRRWPRRFRRLVQALAFVTFLVFVVRIPALAAGRLRGDWLMRFSPFSGIGASLSAWELIGFFWPAAVLLVAALLVGRFFCGWLCPLGATLDLGDRTIALLKGGRPRQ